MNRRNNKHSLQKEKVCMIAASVFVLSALTLTGVYMASIGNPAEEENKIDFAQLEQQSQTQEDDSVELAEGGDDMDVDPDYTEANSAKVTNDRQTADELRDAGRNDMTDARFGEDIAQESAIQAQSETAEEAALTAQSEPTEELAAPTLTFSEDTVLQWPIVGEVLLDYSMDKAIYHATMQQYRYNPSIVIAATEGETITAAADGVVEDIYTDAQTGNTIVFNLGNGYELTYGQLADITLAEGDYVAAGDIVGKVASPTIYYSVEGSNVYFKLTKDGTPIDPLGRLE